MSPSSEQQSGRVSLRQWSGRTAVAIVAVAVLVGCGKLPGKSDNTSNQTPAPQTSTSSAVGDAALCTGDTLSIAATQGPSGSTHRSVILVFTNTSSAPCTMKGFPAVVILDANDQITDSAAEDDSGYLGGLRSGTAPEVTLAPGEKASSMLESLAINQADGSSCTPPPAVKVNPPFDLTHQIKVSYVGDGCSAFEVHPVVPGTTGSL
jgi:hypothetical protein